jgi:hypothetical protein
MSFVFWFRAAPMKALGLAAAIVLSAPKPAALAASPFGRFVGVWTGGGQIVGSNGHRESMRCRAEYSEGRSISRSSAPARASSSTSRATRKPPGNRSRGTGGKQAAIVRSHVRAHLRRSIRGRVQRPHFQCRHFADLQRPDANRGHPASRWGHFRRPNRAQATRLTCEDEAACFAGWPDRAAGGNRQEKNPAGTSGRGGS